MNLIKFEGKAEDWILKHSLTLFASFTGLMLMIILGIILFSTGIFKAEEKTGIVFTIYGVIQNGVIIMYARRHDAQNTETLKKILDLVEEEIPIG